MAGVYSISEHHWKAYRTSATDETQHGKKDTVMEKWGKYNLQPGETPYLTLTSSKQITHIIAELLCVCRRVPNSSKHGVEVQNNENEYMSTQLLRTHFHYREKQSTQHH